LVTEIKSCVGSFRIFPQEIKRCSVSKANTKVDQFRRSVVQAKR